MYFGLCGPNYLKFAVNRVGKIIYLLKGVHVRKKDFGHACDHMFIFSTPVEHVWKVGRYTSAAPMYFKELDNYVDGGVVANNPCQYALTRIQRFLRDQNSRYMYGKKMSGILCSRKLVSNLE